MNSIFFAAALVSSVTCSGPSGRAGADAEVRPLFDGGRSAWVVVVPDGAARPLRYAAEELTNTLAKISGAHFGVVAASEAPRRNVIRLEAPAKEALEDEFSVSAAPGEIVLRGNSPRGALFAAYAFLRDWMGARWYWPGADGEFLPKLGRYDVAAGRREYRPFFKLREMSICSVWRHRHPDTERWLARVFLNCGVNTPEIKEDVGCVRRASGHWVTLPLEMKRREALFAEHPDWFSLLGGKRDIKGIAGCWSNDGFFSYTVSNLVADIRDKRAVLANYFVADIVPRCECADCTRDPDRSARWWNYYARLIDAIRKEVPGMHFAGLAYQEYRAIPGVKVKNLDHVESCQYNRCYYHALGDPDCAMNARSMKEFRGWAEQAPLALYGYEFDVFGHPLYLPMWRVFADEMRVFRDMDLQRVKTEYNVGLHRLAGRNPPPKSQITQLASRLAHYAWAMAAFDPDIDMEALVGDFCRHVYGGGATDMQAYHGLMATAWGGMKTHITYFGNPPRGAADRMITPALAASARAHLSAAAKAAKGDARASAEIALDAECFENWAKLAEEARSGGVMHDLKEFREDAFNMVPWLKAKAKKGKPQPTRFKVYRGADALYVLAECEERENPAFNRGTAKNDAHDWGSDSIEFFIDTGDGACRQIAVTPAGGVWDAKEGDIKWNCGARVRPFSEDGKWLLEMSFPYGAFGGKPKTGDRWKFMAIRNAGKDSKFSSCGWPVNAHRDFSSAATLVFK